MAALNFPTTGLVAGVTQYTSDLGTTYIWDGVKWVGYSAGGSVGTNSISNNGNTVQVDSGGNLVLPAFAIPNTVGTVGQVLKWPASGSVLAWVNDNISGITYSNTNVAAYLVANPQSGTYSNTNVAAYLVANPQSGTYSNTNVAAYLPTYSGNIAANIVKNSYTWTFGTDGNLSLPQGTILSETVNSTTITPPNALAGQSLVVRLTGAQGISSDHPGGFTDGDTITITIIPDYNLTPVTGTVDYTFTGATSQQLGRALTGTLTFTSEPSKLITWTIPVSSTMTTFTITLSNASGFSIAGLSPLTLTTSGSSEDHHIHLIAGDPSITDIYLGDDDQYVKIEKNGGNVVVGTDTNNNQWTFGTDGTTTFPTGTITSNTSLQFATTFGNYRTVEYQTAGVWDVYVEDVTTGPNDAWSWIDVTFKDNQINKPQVFIENQKASDGIARRWTFDENGNLTLPQNGNINFSNGVSILSTVAGTYANANVASYLPTHAGNVQASTLLVSTSIISTGSSPAPVISGFSSISTVGSAVNEGNITASGNLVASRGAFITGNITTTANVIAPNYLFANGVNILTGIGGTYSNANVIANLQNLTTNVTTSANVQASYFIGDGSGLSNVAIKTTGSWTVTTGTNTYSFTVPASGTYQLWVDCNIPNGILVWNATATVTNTNVPVVGTQYAWVYTGGGTPIDFTSIPNQFVGTANTIVRSNTAPSATTNRFDFGISNTSGSSQTAYWGYVRLD